MGSDEEVAPPKYNFEAMLE